LDDIVQRARDVGCQKFMVTGSDLEESKRAIEIAQKYRMLSQGPLLQTIKIDVYQLASAMQRSEFILVRRSFSTASPVGRKSC
jgi:Tat protein secretion system quality control protein TatD with DNase activity